MAPGVSELEVFSQLQAGAVEQFGEPPTATGNDYQCGSPGGPPRSGRTARAGELYILDLGPAYRGYFADNCRTIAVKGSTDQQQAAWACLLQVFAPRGTACASRHEHSRSCTARPKPFSRRLP